MLLRSCAAVLSVAALATGAACPTAASAAVNGPVVVVEDQVYDCPEGCTPPGGQYNLWVAFPGHGFHELRAITGKGVDDLLAYENSSVEPAISPDGRWLAFAAKHHGLDLARVDLAADKVLGRRVLVNMVNDDWVGAVAWSPGGRRLAILGQIHHRSGLFVIESDGSHLRRLVSARQVGVPSFDNRAITSGVAWSTHGKIAFVGSYPLRSGTSIAVSLYIIGADGTGLRGLAVVPRSSTDKFVSPAFSPDGRQLIYQVDTGNSQWLVMHTLATGRNRRLQIDADQPVISPDGRRLAYTEGHRMDSNYTLVTVATLIGANPMRVPHDDNMRDNTYIGDIAWLAG